MKQRVYLNSVEGNADEVTYYEIFYKKNANTGMVDLQKRDSNGNLISIVQNSNITANPNLPVAPITQLPKVQSALATLEDLATEQGAQVSLVHMDSVNIIRECLPDETDVLYKNSNIIGYIGHKTSDGGFVLYSVDSGLLAEVSDSYLTLTKQ